MSRKVIVMAAALAAMPVVGHAQATSEGVPEGWMMRMDRPSAPAEMVNFRTMSPGWHVTTGGRGAAIFWQPDMTARGTYTASSIIHLMRPAEHAEAFGLFVGGRGLEGADQRYLYFLVRQTGEYLIKRRNGSDTEDVVGWTRHESIPVASAEGSTAYTLTVEAGVETVSFQVNGVTVHTLPRARAAVDGVVGLRVNHMLDAHIATLTVSQM